MEPARAVDRVQPTADVVDAGAEARERVGLEVDVAELDRARARGALQPPALARDAGVADRALRVVPDGQPAARRFRACHGAASCAARVAKRTGREVALPPRESSATRRQRLYFTSQSLTCLLACSSVIP